MVPIWPATTGTGNGEGAYFGVDNVSLQPETTVNVAFRYVSTGTGGGDGRSWQVDNIVLRGNPASLLSEVFEGETLADSSFTAVSVASNYDWTIEEHAEQTGVFMNSYGADASCDDWLISSMINLSEGDNAELIFDLYRKYDGPELQVMISTDYSGTGDPAAATWTSTSIPHGDIDDAWKTITVDLAQYSGPIHVAFRYTSTGTGAGGGARLGVDNINVVRGLP
ncbi:choice-of-anchor J domain-containing protein, partial [Candidatus Bipolaricaulota bacterium]|nr:choice-of-anchor J domain-containing protein [Candidatus Bipolaricaulota bacterium]